jgi:hypothetical protein
MDILTQDLVILGYEVTTKTFLDLYAVAPDEEGWMSYVFNIVLVVGGARTATLLQTVDFPKGVGTWLVREAKKLVKPYKNVNFLNNFQGVYIYRGDKLPKSGKIRKGLEAGDDDIVANFLDFLCIGEYAGGSGSDYSVGYFLTYRGVEESFIGYGCNSASMRKKKRFLKTRDYYQEFADTLGLGIDIEFTSTRSWTKESLIELLKSRRRISEEAIGGIDNLFWNWGLDGKSIGLQITEDVLKEDKQDYRKDIKRYIPAWIEAIRRDEEVFDIYDTHGYTNKSKKKVLMWEKSLYSTE